MNESASPASAPEERRSRRVTIVNKRGLHARAAARFARLAERFAAEITVTGNGLSVPGCSIMGLMLLAAGLGTAIDIAASGADAEEALDALATLVEAGFDEE